MKVGTDGVLLGAWVALGAADRRLLDVGTGTGVIALMLAQRSAAAHVTALDIDAACSVQARANADRSPWGGRVTTLCTPVQEYRPEEPFDLVVSNPPYVPQSDRAAMHPNVRDHEPAEALFVPDGDPLRFYRAIARAGRRMLEPGGKLYFEIYHTAAGALERLLAEEGYGAIRLREDMNGKPRMLCARLN